MPVLQIRDKDGKFVPIPAVKGDDGKSAYEQAKEGGYVGTEEEFIALLNGLTASADADHYADFNNPHKVTKDQVGLGNVDNTSDADKPVSTAQAAAINAHTSNKANPHEVTAKQVGAIPEAYYASSDLNTEIQQGGGKMTVCSYHSGTLNTPYKQGLTIYAHGMVITNAYSEQYGSQLCIPSGSSKVYVRRLDGSGISQWVDIADREDIDFLQSQIILHGELLPKLARVASGSYRGTNTYGTKNPNTLTFDFVPMFVMVSKRGEGNATGGGTFMWINPGSTLNFINNGSNYWCHPTLSGTTLSWYCADSSSYQLNSSSYDYDYLAWGL